MDLWVDSNDRRDRIASSHWCVPRDDKSEGTLLERGYENKLSDSIITARHLGESIESYKIYFPLFLFIIDFFIGRLHMYLKRAELITSQKKKKK